MNDPFDFPDDRPFWPESRWRTFRRAHPPIGFLALLIGLTMVMGVLAMTTSSHPQASPVRASDTVARTAAVPTTTSTTAAHPQAIAAGSPATLASTTTSAPKPVAAKPAAKPAATLWGPGYRLAAADGGVFSYGNARFLGSMGGSRLAAPVVALAETPDGLGYWEAASDGGVFSFGDAHYLGGASGRRLSAPVVGLAARPTGAGYWLVSSDGGVFTFGDAPYLGSLAGRRLSAPVVGMAATPDGGGYWLVSADGGVFTFGDAQYFGGMAGNGIAARIVGLAPVPNGSGYYLVAADGGVFTYGTAHYFGGMGGQKLAEPVVGMAVNADGGGYWLAAADGGVFTYGSSGFWGAPGGYSLYRPVTAVAAGLDPAYHAADQVEIGGRYGFDVSWPQCEDRGLPSGHAFAILGITGGKAFTANPCLASQWAWATAAAGAGGLYINMNEPQSGPRSNMGPAGRCKHGDLACTAYNYGANSVDSALAYARSQGAEAPTIWLDVETGNAWTPYKDVNALVIKGALDQLHRLGKVAGIYSTSLQWGEITGGANFGVPVWVAGSPDLATASSWCTGGFNGGPVWMVQTMLSYDVNYLCSQSYAAKAFGTHPLPTAPVFRLERKLP